MKDRHGGITSPHSSESAPQERWIWVAIVRIFYIFCFWHTGLYIYYIKELRNLKKSTSKPQTFSQEQELQRLFSWPKGVNSHLDFEGTTPVKTGPFTLPETNSKFALENGWVGIR